MSCDALARKRGHWANIGPRGPSAYLDAAMSTRADPGRRCAQRAHGTNQAAMARALWYCGIAVNVQGTSQLHLAGPLVCLSAHAHLCACFVERWQRRRWAVRSLLFQIIQNALHSVSAQRQSTVEPQSGAQRCELAMRIPKRSLLLTPHFHNIMPNTNCEESIFERRPNAAGM